MALNALAEVFPTVRKSTSSKRVQLALPSSFYSAVLFPSLVLIEFWTEKPRPQGAFDTEITGLIKVSCTKSE